MATVTLDVRGIKLRTRTNRRFVAVAVRPEDIPVGPPEHKPGSVLVKFAHVEKRSDNIDTIRKFARRGASGRGAFVVVFDTTTGMEVQ